MYIKMTIKIIWMHKKILCKYIIGATNNKLSSRNINFYFHFFCLYSYICSWVCFWGQHWVKKYHPHSYTYTYICVQWNGSVIVDHNDMFNDGTRICWMPEAGLQPVYHTGPHAHFKQRRYPTTITICYGNSARRNKLNRSGQILKTDKITQ